jgi:trk system potassium uptake protein TrkA
MYILIVGGGKVGSHLATMLRAGGHTIKVIELRAEHVAELASSLPDTSVVAGNGTDPDILERAGIRQAQVVAAVTGADETNLVATSLARFEFRVGRTIARVNNPRNAWLFTAEMGVDVAVNQADIMAHLIVEEMSLGNMMTLLKLRRGEYALVEEKVHPASPAAGTALQHLNLPRECIVTAVLHKGAMIIPRGDTVLQSGDEILAVVHSDQAGALAALLGEPPT